MGGGGVKVVVALLGVLTMVTLGAGQTKDSLLEDWVFLVPEGEGKAEAALAVADAQQTVLPPAVGPGASVVVREVLPAGERGRDPSKQGCTHILTYTNHAVIM